MALRQEGAGQSRGPPSARLEQQTGEARVQWDALHPGAGGVS